MKYDLIKNLVYILQLEHYDKKRMLSFAYKNFWKIFNTSKRGKIVWTLRAKEEYFLSWFLILSFIFLTKYYFNFKLWIIFILVFVGLPFFVFLADTIISPYIKYKKNQIFKKATKILENSKIQIIGITGSYGKTSTKYILEKILSEKFKILKTEGNINTDIGISNFVIKNKNILDNYDFFIVEMGAYRIGDIKLLSKITKPVYSITTSIGKNHLERFGSQENIIKAKFELAQNTKNKSFLNGCDKNIQNNYQNFLQNKNYEIFCPLEKIENFQYLDDFKGISFEYKNTKFTSQFLAKHSIINILLSTSLAEELGLDLDEIKKAVAKIQNVEHRLYVIKNKNTGVTVIDDSYNGNYDGFISGIEILKNAKGRKIVLTPGIVELTKKEKEEIHKELAKRYMENVDLIILIKNSQTEIIKEYFDKNNFKNYKIYNSAKEAHEDLKNILKSGDTIIFQNDLPDNYN